MYNCCQKNLLSPNLNKSVDVVFRDEFDGDVCFNAAFPKFTSNYQKRKTNQKTLKIFESFRNASERSRYNATMNGRNNNMNGRNSNMNGRNNSAC